MAVFADKAFELLAEGNLTVSFAWLGAVAYTLQIYFDFSGYSDMAIGLGKMFGFEFPINFDYPYISRSITEFWRRWHISLSTWFRDYVYIPLGGNRCSKKRMFFNLFIVWMLTGIWHGANYTFWLWGLLYYLILVFEKMIGIGNKEHNRNHLKNAIGHIYTMFIVMILWIIFRADSVMEAYDYIKHMFIVSDKSEYAVGVTKLYCTNFIGYGILAILGCTPWIRSISNWISQYHNKKLISILKQSWIVVIFILACCVTIDSDYNPFIYFNF